MEKKNGWKSVSSSMNSHSLKFCTHISTECLQNKSKQDGNDSCNKLQLKVLLRYPNNPMLRYRTDSREQHSTG